MRIDSLTIKPCSEMEGKMTPERLEEILQAVVVLTVLLYKTFSKDE